MSNGTTTGKSCGIMRLEDYLTISDAAREIGISEGALRKRIERNLIPSTNYFGRVLLHKNDVKAAKQ